MNLPLFNLKNQEGLIEDVYLHPLKVNRDSSGILVETLKTNLPAKIYSSNSRPFAQQYYSVTAPGIARDESEWHVHQSQEDRFLCPKGNIIVAIFDSRADSSTAHSLNLFEMGEAQGDQGQYIVLIPKNTLHGFMVVGDKDALLLNFPTQLYNLEDEGRISHSDVNAKVDGEVFSWEIVRQNYHLS